MATPARSRWLIVPGKCVDTLLDPANCGGCGTACKTGEVCSAGSCGMSCVGGTKLCSGKCIDTRFDPSNCGRCKKACRTGQVCSAGTCAAFCQNGQTKCSGKCVNTQTDSTNCGACGKSCGTGQICTKGQCFTLPGTWKTIKAGTFQMGSPTSESCRHGSETQHQVTLTHKFEIMTTEVTQAQLKQVMGYSPSYFTKCGGTCPVEQVNWHEAVAYANALSTKFGKAKCYACTGSGKSVKCSEATAYAGKKVYTCPGYRLPTEAEWEFAYRAGTSTAFYNGGITSCTSKDANLDKIGWYRENSQVSYAGSLQGRGTHPVGGKTPNAWGLYDMAGNVWEWCHDWYGYYPSSSVTDPVGTSGSRRVLRGGNWSYFANYARAASRSYYGPGTRVHALGFRLARSVL